MAHDLLHDFRSEHTQTRAWCRNEWFECDIVTVIDAIRLAGRVYERQGYVDRLAPKLILGLVADPG